MVMLAEVVDTVIGVDTHLDTHTMAVCNPTGGVLFTGVFTTDPIGLAALIGAALERSEGARVAFAVEGSRSHGIGLSRALLAQGLAVIEVDRPDRKKRRGTGKSDVIDAVFAARTALGYDADRLPTPRADGDREALRILLISRRDGTDERTAKVNLLRSLLHSSTYPDEQQLATGGLTIARLAAIAGLSACDTDTRMDVLRRAEARRLALRISELDRWLKDNKRQLTELVNTVNPTLLDRIGIGPVSAAQVIVSWSHPGRCRSEAAFAALAGASPLPASSGRTRRHRLNRGGDRALNRALHDVIQNRMRYCARTRDYTDRRRGEGKSDREIRRCLKRYLARELYRALEAHQPLDNT